VADARELLRDAEARLSAAGVGSPRVDAELLLAEVLGTSRVGLLTAGTVEPAGAATFAEAVRRRVAREPLQHIIGRAPFRHLELAVGPGVFIPRPETELLVDEVLARLEPGDVVVDLCAGSGAIGLAVLDERPGTRVVAVEREESALSWLRRNAAGSPLEIVPGDIRDENLLADLDGLVDIVVSNPPYVPAASPVEPEVDADPAIAVFAGADGADLLPPLVARAADLLAAGGLLAFEHDDSHAELASRILREDGRWEQIVGRRDLAGRPRFTAAVRAGIGPTDT